MREVILETGYGIQYRRGKLDGPRGLGFCRHFRSTMMLVF